MSLRGRRGPALYVALGALAVAAHLVIGTWSVLTASRWLGWTVAAAALAAVIAAHVIGLRRLARRRRGAATLDNPRTDHE